MKIIKNIAIVLILIFSSCNNNKLQKTPIDKFIGTWELKGRKMTNGIQIKIHKNKKGDLIGKVVKLNNNKYVKYFVDINDILISKISRKSNYEFKITERKIASELFGYYGINTSDKFIAQFIGNDTIGLGKGNSDPQKSNIFYIRIK